MSKFLREIRANLINKEEVVYEPLKVVLEIQDITDEPTSPRGHYQKVLIEVVCRIESRFKKTEEFQVLPEIMNSCLEELRYVIYEDFIILIRKLERSIYERDELKSREILKQIQKEVFGN